MALTEQELQNLRDFLVYINNDLDNLLNRVITMESLALPDQEYFTQLKESFEGSPECCSCDGNGGTGGEISCEGATNEVVLENYYDWAQQYFIDFEINGVTKTLDECVNVSGWLNDNFVSIFASMRENHILDGWQPPALSIKSTSDSPIRVKVRRTTAQYNC